MERMREDQAADEALAELVRRYQDELVGFFYHHCWQQLTAEELAQTVFIKMYQARSRWQPTAKVRTYMYRIAHNAWIDHVRKAARNKQVSLDAEYGSNGLRLVDAMESRDSNASESSEANIRVRIEEAVDALPEGQQAVFVLANNQNMRYAEISEVLGIPEGTVKSRMHNAVRHLRNALKDLVEP
jgi:RNA polymerase sigma-70 factor (ECF subfamily)